MKIEILAIGHKMPSWIDDAYRAYNKRLQGHFRPALVELNGANHGKNYIPDKAKLEEGQRLIKATSPNSLKIALDERGKSVSSKQLAKYLDDWQMMNQTVSFMIGGADGLHADCKKQADVLWSLSSLTFPHGLVRVILIEQLYRAYSILHGHPYHRE